MLPSIKRLLGVVCAASITLTGLQPVFALAPPPAGNVCVLNPEFCTFTPTPPVPDLVLTVNNKDIRSSLRIDLGTVTSSKDALTITIGYRDVNNVFNSSTVCTAAVAKNQSLILTAALASNPTPWDTQSPLTPAPIVFPVRPLIVSNIPTNTSNIRLNLGISCEHGGKTYNRTALLTFNGRVVITPGGYWGTNTPLDPIPDSAKDPAWGDATITWGFSETPPNLDACSITQNAPIQGSFKPNITRYSSGFIKARPGTRTISFLYPKEPGTKITYKFTLHCDNSSNNADVVYIFEAYRLPGSGGFGGGNVYNYVDGSTSFE